MRVLGRQFVRRHLDDVTCIGLARRDDCTFEPKCAAGRACQSCRIEPRKCGLSGRGFGDGIALLCRPPGVSAWAGRGVRARSAGRIDDTHIVGEVGEVSMKRREPPQRHGDHR